MKTDEQIYVCLSEVNNHFTLSVSYYADFA